LESDTTDYLSVINLFVLLAQIDWSFLSFCLILVILIACSGLISACEVAYFSISPSTLRSLEEEDDDNNKKIIQLRNKPQLLLATILIGNNFVNVAIIIVSQIILTQLLSEPVLISIGNYLDQNLFLGLFNPEQLAIGFNFFVTTIVVTFLLLLFGEAGPKIYANLNSLKVARFMAGPLSFLNFIFSPLSSILVRWSNSIEKKVSQNRNYQTGTSKEDLDHAIEITVSQNEEAHHDAELLKGIVKFGDMSARQVMKPRVDVVAIEKTMDFAALLKTVNESGYSRLPVYEEDFDNIIGILYVKDLIGYTSEAADFDWLQLVRSSLLYIPETKKIDDLLREIQSKRLHMAIVVDEFGGTLGIVTLEDIMEEVLGEINDETDGLYDDVDYVKLSEGNYIFEGKTLLNDLCRIIGEKTSYFDDIKGQGDSIGGLITELLGHIPKPEKELNIKNLKFKIVASNARRIEKINIKVIK
jgi:putative hemolysin